MRLALDANVIEQLRPKYRPDSLRAFAAHADEPDSSSGEPLEGGHADLLLKATGQDLVFVELEEERSAHDRAFRLAAKMTLRAIGRQASADAHSVLSCSSSD
jgi:hypothetical protein